MEQFLNQFITATGNVGEFTPGQIASNIIDIYKCKGIKPPYTRKELTEIIKEHYKDSELVTYWQKDKSSNTFHLKINFIPYDKICWII